MSTQIPFTKFSGYLRSIASDNLTEGQKALMEAVFPEFLDRDPGPEQQRHLEEQAKIVDYQLVLRRPCRRYSGDPLVTDMRGLTRGRYSSIAEDAFGHDWGTLKRELCAYKVDPNIFVFDLASELEVSLLREVYQYPGDRYPGIAIGLPTPGGRAFRSLDVGVRYEEIDHCIDLRLPQTQSWFFDT
jgi:hypothetical protein